MACLGGFTLHIQRKGNMITQAKFDKDTHLNHMIDGILKKNPEARVQLLKTENGWEMNNIEPMNQRFTAKLRTWFKKMIRTEPAKQITNKVSY